MSDIYNSEGINVTMKDEVMGSVKYYKENGHIDAIKYLLQKSVKINVFIFNELEPPNPIHFELIKILLDGGSDITLTNKSGNQPLHWVSTHGNYRIAKAILNKEGNSVVNIKNSYGRTAIHFASEEGHIDVLNLLIEAGGDLNIEDKFGLTPLYASKDIEVAKILLLKGAHVSTEKNFEIGNRILLALKDDEDYNRLLNYCKKNYTQLDVDVVISMKRN